MHKIGYNSVDYRLCDLLFKYDIFTEHILQDGSHEHPVGLGKVESDSSTTYLLVPRRTIQCTQFRLQLFIMSAACPETTKCPVCV